MKFTFGIISSPETSILLESVINSIVAENIPDYEIIVVGGEQEFEEEQLKIIPFDDSVKPKWITRKKNIITENAKYENIAYFHDYIRLVPGWYEGFLTHGDQFDVCMTKMENLDRTRFRDWVLWPEDCPFLDNRECLIPYNMTHLTKRMYISGSYWIAKKQFMMDHPLDESLMWGDSEDVVWSKEVRAVGKISMNPHSSVKLMKYKPPCFDIASSETIQLLNAIPE